MLPTDLKIIKKQNLKNVSDLSPSLRCPLLEPVSSAFFLCSESGSFSLLGNRKVCQTLQRQQQPQSSLSFVGLVHHFTSQVCYLKIKENEEQKWFDCVVREGVGTSNFTTMTGHFFHYIRSVFLVHHYYYNQNIKSVILVHRHCNKNQTFDVLILPMASKKITTSKIKISTTYGILPMVTKACGALGG